VSLFLSEAARQLEAERDAMMAENEELDGRRLDEVENRARAETERDAAREDVGALQVIVRGLTEERDQLRERIASLEAEADRYHVERDDAVGQLLKLRAERDAARVETVRSGQRLTRIRTVARMAEQFIGTRVDCSPGCDCVECCLRAAIYQLEEGDV